MWKYPGAFFLNVKSMFEIVCPNIVCLCGIWQIHFHVLRDWESWDNHREVSSHPSGELSTMRGSWYSYLAIITQKKPWLHMWVPIESHKNKHSKLLALICNETTSHRATPYSVLQGEKQQGLAYLTMVSDFLK